MPTTNVIHIPTHPCPICGNPSLSKDALCLRCEAVPIYTPEGIYTAGALSIMRNACNRHRLDGEERCTFPGCDCDNDPAERGDVGDVDFEGVVG